MKNKEILIRDAEAHFASLPADIFIALRNIGAKNGKIYGPHQRATGPDAETTFSLEPRSELEGRLTLSEITALLLIHNETRMLAIQFHKGGAEQSFVREILSITDDDWPSEVIEGMAGFVHLFVYVAGVRDRKAMGNGKPTGTTVREKNLRYWWDHFAGLIGEDGILETPICQQLVEVVGEMASRNVFGEDAEIRAQSQRKGAELAAMLYLNVLGLDRVDPATASNF